MRLKLSFTTKAVILLAILSALLSFAKFDHCYTTNWIGASVDVHECYSDLPALFGARGLDHHAWPYSSATNSVEYPPITGLVMWATSLITPSGNGADKIYYLINFFFIALLFIGTCIVVSKINPAKWYLLPILPVVIEAAYINWDMWAVISAIASIYWFDRKKYDLSAIALAISIATKFFPIVLLIPIALILFKEKKFSALIRYFGVTAVLWLVINAPFIITTPTGWYRFFKLNESRPADLGSLWQAFNIFNVNTPGLNFLWIAIFAALSLFAGIKIFFDQRIPTLAHIAFIFVAIFTALNKVYSPQYVVWLAPLAVIALINNRDRAAFWVWQGAEVFYHFAIWEYLAGYSGAKFGLPAKWYAAAIFIRVATSLYFATKLLFSTPKTPAQEPEFLQNAPAS